MHIEKSRSMMILVAAAAALLLAPAYAHAQGKSQNVGTDTIALQFAWPRGLHVDVDAERLRIRTGERADTSGGTVTYEMSTRPGSDGGLIVSYGKIGLGESVNEPAEMQAVMQQLSGLMPNFRVSSKGEFLGVVDVALLKARVDSMFEPLVAEDSSGQMRSLLQSMLSEDFLNASTAQEWNLLVGMWADAKLELGETYWFEEEAAVPIIPGATVKMVSQFSVEKRVGCIADDDTKQECVQIRLFSEPDTASMKQVLKDFMERMTTAVGAGEGPAFDKLAVQSEVLLITRPESLVPYYLEVIKDVEAVVRAEGETATVSQSDQRKYNFKYR